MLFLNPLLIGRMEELPRPHALEIVFHYRQAPGTQPSVFVLPRAYELIELVTEGRGWVLEGDDWLEVGVGSLLWHVGGDQTIGRSDPSNPYACLAIRMKSHLGLGVRRVPRISFWRADDSVARLAEEAVGIYRDENFDREALLDHLYSKLRYEALLYHHRRGQAVLAEPLRLAWSIIESRYQDPIKIADIAKSIGWSVAHMHDKFREAFHSTPRQMLLERRLSSACEQLVGTQNSVKQIAANTGFTHSSAFCAAFRRRFGKTPKSYREAYYQQGS